MKLLKFKFKVMLTLKVHALPKVSVGSWGKVGVGSRDHFHIQFLGVHHTL